MSKSKPGIKSQFLSLCSDGACENPAELEQQVPLGHAPALVLLNVNELRAAPRLLIGPPRNTNLPKTASLESVFLFPSQSPFTPSISAQQVALCTCDFGTEKCFVSTFFFPLSF